jgi:hypothetical protein
MTDDEKRKALVVELSKQLVDKGMLIEAGWTSLRMMILPDNTPAIQLEMMRDAFFAGAQHLFGTVANILDDDREPTDADMRRMDQINDELKRFIAAYAKKHGLERG